MGQLEKYGLYVLCLLIFLILGVTLWGSGEVEARGDRSRAPANDLNASSDPGAGGATATPAAAPAEQPRLPDFRALLQPNAMPAVKSGPEPRREKGEKGEPKAEPATPPASAARTTHRVKSGDTFESLARKYYGDPLLRSEISRLNPTVDPLRMQIDQELVLPSAAEVEAFRAAHKRGKPAVAAGDSYTIVLGDTLEGIALRVYGTRRRVKDIERLNPGVDPTNLKIGSTLKLPAK